MKYYNLLLLMMMQYRKIN